VDLTSLRQDPYSPHPREGAGLSDRFALDANVNPRDARQDQERGQLNLSLTHPLDDCAWVTTLSFAHMRSDSTRGFLREDFAVDGVTPNADGFRQRVTTTDVYFDSYLALPLTSAVDVIVGVDWLYGKGEQHSDNFEYAVRPDGSNRPDSHDLPVDEMTFAEDERSFAGIYGQVSWRPAEPWHLSAGLRLNRTSEKRAGEEIAGDGAESEGDAARRDETRLSGALGVSYLLWSRGPDYVTAYADYRNTFKPAAVDFGPEAEAAILDPESAESVEGGVRGRTMDGRLEWEADVFEMDRESRHPRKHRRPPGSCKRRQGALQGRRARGKSPAHDSTPGHG
jgi:iron complex outermembrane recepter protein